MTKLTYQQRLKSDLGRWVQNGWVQPEHTNAILKDARSSASTSKVPMIVGILGAILLAAGVVLFVSANWQEMSKLTRLGLLMGALWVTFAIAVWINRSSHKYLLEAILLLGAIIFGANIILIAQIYHIDNHYPDGILVWAAGALLVTLLLKSRAALILAFGLIIWWAGAEIIDFGKNPFWPFLPVWAIAAGLTYWLSLRLGLHLAFLSLIAWIIASLDKLVKLLGLTDNEIAIILVLLPLVIFVYGLVATYKNRPWTLSFGRALSNYGIITFLAVSSLTQVIPRQLQVAPGAIPLVVIMIIGALIVLAAVINLRNKVFSPLDFGLFLGFALWYCLIWFYPIPGRIWLPAAVFLGLTIWLLAFAQKREDQLLVTVALIAFGGEVLYLYIETLGTLLDTSLFFLLGGVLLVALSFALETFRRYLKRRDQAREVTP